MTLFLISQAADQLMEMVANDREALKEEFSAQRALNCLMHLQMKKMSDDLHDLSMERASLVEDNGAFRDHRKEIESKDRDIRSMK